MAVENQVQPPAPKEARKYRKIFDAKNGASLPGELVRSEGDPPTKDQSVNEVYDALGTTYDFFWNIYRRDSFDGNGAELRATVHFQTGYDQAFWNGREIIVGDGDENLPENERIFNRFSISIDNLAGKFTYGVVQQSAALVYWEQSGALNVSMSDIFGSLVKQYQKKQLARAANWIIGEEVFTRNVKGLGLRSLKAPGTAYDDPILGKDPQPAHMKDYVKTVTDNGGVHINSGIPNHAFYLIAMEIGGFAWEKAGFIWYRALTEKLQEKSNFQDAARETFLMAGEIFGSESIEQQAVRMGWESVGIEVSRRIPRKIFSLFKRNK